MGMPDHEGSDGSRCLVRFRHALRGGFRASPARLRGGVRKRPERRRTGPCRVRRHLGVGPVRERGLPGGREGLQGRDRRRASEAAVAFHGQAVRLLSTDAADHEGQDPSEVETFRKRLAKMRDDGVEPEVCAHARKGPGVDPESVIPAVAVAPNGSVSVVGCQALGYEVVRIPGTRRAAAADPGGTARQRRGTWRAGPRGAARSRPERPAPTPPAQLTPDPSPPRRQPAPIADAPRSSQARSSGGRHSEIRAS